MTRERQGRSLIHDTPFILNLEALPRRFRIRDFGAPSEEAPLRDTLRRWYLLGTAGVALALLAWLGI